MKLLRPREPRSPLDADGVCPMHMPDSRRLGFETPRPGEARLWSTTRDVGGLIAPGTRLRLDGVRQGGAYLHDGAWSAYTRRFCVLEGPMAGTCWEETQRVSQFDADRGPASDSAAPVERSG